MRSTCGRYVATDCAVCRGPVLLTRATPIPRYDARGALTPEIAAYVCHRRVCFIRAAWDALPKSPSPAEESE